MTCAEGAMIALIRLIIETQDIIAAILSYWETLKVKYFYRSIISIFVGERTPHQHATILIFFCFQ